MTTDFPRILLALRKEHKLTQKQAAKDLAVAASIVGYYVCKWLDRDNRQ